MTETKLLDTIVLLNDNEGPMSLVLKDTEFLFSSKEHSSFEEFKIHVDKKEGSFLNFSDRVTYTSIFRILYNEHSPTISIRYTNSKLKECETNLGFNTQAQAFEFAELIASITKLKKTIKEESVFKALYLNVFWILVSGALTYFAAFGSLLEIKEGSFSKSDRNAHLYNMIVGTLQNTVGQKGIFVIGFIITIMMTAMAYNKYKNPSKVHMYVSKAA